MSIRPTVFLRTLPRLIPAATSSTVEPSSSNANNRSRLANRTPYSTNASTNAPLEGKFKIPPPADVNHTVLNGRQKPPEKRPEGKSEHRRRPKFKKPEPIPSKKASPSKKMKKTKTKLTGTGDQPPVGTELSCEPGEKANASRIYLPHDVPEIICREGRNVANDGLEALPVLTDVPYLEKHNEVSQLSHGLDRVLFNPGVHWLQDPRSHVYNFTPWLEKIPKVHDFAFERLSGFISSSRDTELLAMAKQENKKFAGSTSSLTGMLSHLYFLLTQYRDFDPKTLSQAFQSEPSGFTPGQRMPAMTILKYKDGIYAVDTHASEWDDPEKNVLTWMGTLLENFLTKSPEAFNTFMRAESSAPPELSEEPVAREAYRYSKSNNFIMRSQLDCRDPRLPGTGVFDVKTRACVAVRMDILNYEENAGYTIKSQHGVFESFEREYYDLIRSGFLKYSFQARIGNMDGVFVAYHNTERIFGFQYISLDEMDERLLGPNPGIGNKVFNHCVNLLEAILEEASACFPHESVILVMETAPEGKWLDVFVQPGEWSGALVEKPIKQLRVVIEHELDGATVKAPAALMSTVQQWHVRYQITKMDIPDYLIRDNYNTVMLRKKRTHALPSSVPLEEAEDYWRSLNFGSKTSERDEKLPFNIGSFSASPGHVIRYRLLAKHGRVETREKEKFLAGRPKIVYGQGVYEPEDSPFFPKSSEKDTPLPETSEDDDKTLPETSEDDEKIKPSN